MSTSSSARLYSVLPQHLPEVWSDVAHLIQEAVKYCDGKWTLADVKEAILSGGMQLLLVVDNGIRAAVVTQFYQYPSKKVLTVMFLGGSDMGEWLHLLSEIEQWAKDEGCQSIEVHGRSGWERVLGWEKVSTVVRKNLEG